MSDKCETHPPAASAVKAAARTAGAMVEGRDFLKQANEGHTGTGACPDVPLSHETSGRGGHPTLAHLNEIVQFAAGSGDVSKITLLENAMRERFANPVLRTHTDIRWLRDCLSWLMT